MSHSDTTDTVISLKYYGIFRCQHKSFYLHGDFPPEASTDDALWCRKTMTLVCWSVIVDTICQLHNSIPLRDFKSVSGRQISAIYFLSFKIRRSNAFCRINNYYSPQKMSKLSLQVCGGSAVKRSFGLTSTANPFLCAADISLIHTSS